MRTHIQLQHQQPNTDRTNDNGSDANDGYSVEAAKQTLEGAAAALAEDCPGQPGVLMLGEGTFTVQSRVQLLQPFSLLGAGASRTTVRAAPGLAYSWLLTTFMNVDSSLPAVTVDGVTVSGIEFDMAWVPAASCLGLFFVRNVMVRDTSFRRVGEQGWGAQARRFPSYC